MMSDGWATGVQLAVTGISRCQRTAIESLIARGGGSYTSTLSRRNTHLLVPESPAVPTPKFQTAMAKGRAWGLSVVTLAWALDSDRLQRRQPETDYAVISEARDRPLAARPTNAEAPLVPAPPLPLAPANELADDLSRLSLSKYSGFMPVGELRRQLRKAGDRAAARSGSAGVAAGAEVGAGGAATPRKCVVGSEDEVEPQTHSLAAPTGQLQT